MNRSTGLLATAMLTLGFLTAPGCFLSSSSESSSESSDSVSNSSESSSDSSVDSSGGDSAYRGDIQTYTVAHVQADGNPDTLPLGLSEVALARGISDWEALPGTFVAVGAGLARAGVSQDGLSAYQNALAKPGTANYKAVRKGFDSASATE